MVKLMKGLAIFFLIIGIIMSIVLGVAFPAVSYNTNTLRAQTEHFNTYLFISVLLSSVILFALFYSAGYAMALLESINEQLHSLVETADRKKPTVWQTSVSVQSAAPVKAPPRYTGAVPYDTVVCKKCGAFNPKWRTLCKKCSAVLEKE
mgnify:CR=1 FL=1